MKSLLGRGGMGEVYRGWDTRLARAVAIKVLPAAYSTNPDRLRRFAQEARAAAALNHPNIVAVFDVGTETETPYVISELLEGQTLREALGAGRLSVRKAVDYAIQIAAGLAAAHEKGIIHRDLKPENVFVTTDGRVKLLDFGLAKLVEDNVADASLTRADASASSTGGMVIGTAGYMSPEQVRAEPVDHRTDVFSFGATFYEMVSGVRAFRGNTAIETLHAILNHDPPELTTVDGFTTPGLARVIHRCLEKEPAQRFQSAQDLAFALGQLTTSSNSGAVVSPTLARSWWRWTAAAVAVVVGLGMAGAWYLAGTRANDPTQPVFRQLYFRRGQICCPRFAPDGQTVISNVKWDGGGWAIISTRLDTLASTPLDLPNAQVLAVSRTGELAVLVGGSTLARVPLGLGGTRQIADHVIGADWAPDGGLAATRTEGGKYWLEYPQGQKIYEDTNRIYFPRVSPDGQLVAVSQQQATGGNDEWTTIVDRRGVVRSRSQKRKAIGQEGAAWTPDGREVWFTAGDSTMKSAIFAMTPDGRERVVHRSAGSVRIEDIAPDGRALVIQDVNRADMIAVDMATRAERDFSWLDHSRPTALSRDGQLLLFRENGGPDEQVGAYMRQTNGGPAVRLGDGTPKAVSPDKKWVLVSNATATGQMLLPTGAGEIRTLESGSVRQFSGLASWTPDGQRIVFVGSEADRPRRAFVQSLSGGAPTPVSPEGVQAWPVVSLDSSMILTVDAKGRLWKHPLNGRARILLDGSLPGDVPVGWSADGKAVWVRSPFNETRVRVFRLDLTTGRRALWYDVPYNDPASIHGQTLLHVAADGSTLVYSYQRWLADLYLATGLK